MDAGVSSAPKRPTVIRFRIRQRRSIRLTPPDPVLTVDKAYGMILQDTLQSPRSDKEVPGGRWDSHDEEVEITNVVIPVNVNKEEEEITEVYELKRREKGKIVEESRSPPFPTPISSPRIYTDLVSSDTKKLQELTERGKLQADISSQIQKAIVTNIPSLVDASVDPQLQQQDIAIWLAVQMKFETLQVPQTTCRTPAIRSRDQDNPHDDAHPKGENSAKRQKTSEYEAHVTGESSGQVNEKEQDDDEVPMKQVSQDIMKEVSLTINEAKLEKRVMRHSEIHKFCDATLNRVLEEEIEVRLKYRNQMRRWEMYVNGRPLGPRRERPE
ncbi:hypothetical protein Tco_1313855 [Tanacetum coccineum]